MGVEEILITKVLDKGDLKSVMKLKITGEFFLDKINKAIFLAIVNYYQAPETRGSVPSWGYIKNRFKKFKPERNKQKLHAVCHELRERKLSSLIQQSCAEALQSAWSDPLNAFTNLRDQIITYQETLSEAQDLTLSDGVKLAEQRYKEAKKGGGLLGIPWPWPSLTKASQGMQPGQLIFFYGRRKSMKSWMALKACVNAFLGYQKRVMIFTWEVRPEEIMFRVAALLAGVDYDDFKNGALNKENEEKAFRFLKALRYDEKKSNGDLTKPRITVATTAGAGESGVLAIRHKVEEFKPDLVLVDGIYNIKDDREKKRSFDWRNQANVVQDVHQVGIDFGFPMIATTQANRGGADPFDENNKDVSFTDASSMFCDYMIKNYKIDQGDHALIFCRLKATRDFRMVGFQTMVRPAYQFDEVQTFRTDDSLTDAIKIITGDGKDVKKKGRNGAGKIDLKRKNRWT